MSKSRTTITATADFAATETVSIEPAKPEGFFQGATWSLQKLAKWLETTKFKADDAVSQQAVDNTKKLIAEQARHAADELRDR